jgi:sugar lactone lactonase YvrE
LEGESYGGGPHPASETWNDGKVSPDGHWFGGTVDNTRLIGYDNSDIMQYYWTMEGGNKIAPLLYRFDPKNKVAHVQEQVGHHICANGPTWS